MLSMHAMTTAGQRQQSAHQLRVGQQVLANELSKLPVVGVPSQLDGAAATVDLVWLVGPVSRGGAVGALCRFIRILALLHPAEAPVGGISSSWSAASCLVAGLWGGAGQDGCGLPAYGRHPIGRHAEPACRQPSGRLPAWLPESTMHDPDHVCRYCNAAFLTGATTNMHVVCEEITPAVLAAIDAVPLSPSVPDSWGTAYMMVGLGHL